MKIGRFLGVSVLVTGLLSTGARGKEPVRISGIYPHLAAFNGGGECGIGAVVPWAGRLWFMTYPPHHPKGGPDKLYQIDEDLNLRIRPESVGGTHAGRMIHRESNQLIMGPYFIDAKGKVRAADITKLVGRLTAVARHLTDPANKVYLFDMEGKLYEVNVHTLAVKKLFTNPIPGDHGKGGYTGQGRLVLANNGERRPKRPGAAGALGEWDGKTWNVVERKQFCEVTGPGGIHGAPSDDSCLWATGWDKRSVILKLLDKGRWRTYRLPKASRCHDPVHGWYTEWPRIRRIAPGRMLMDMHGMFYDFPPGFRAADAGGLRPISTHLRMVVDFCNWKGRVVFASDDASVMRNPLAGQSQSNLWFAKPGELSRLGPAAGWGGPWMADHVKAGQWSDPFLTSGFTRRCLHLTNDSGPSVTFTLQIDRDGRGKWGDYKSITVPAGGYVYHIFPAGLAACWVRLKADKACTATAQFHCSSPPGQAPAPGGLFDALAPAAGPTDYCAGLLLPASGKNRNLQFLATTVGPGGKAAPSKLHEIDEKMKFRPVADAKRAAAVAQKAKVRQDFTVDAASVVVKRKGKTYRLPKTDGAYDTPWPAGWPRAVREVVTERFLMNCHGTFYEVPCHSFAPIRPVCTHGRRITDFCSWRGLLVISGTSAAAKPDGHLFGAAGGVGLWFGKVDDLWKLGKPRGKGGPWKDARVKAGAASDPYLMTGYDRKSVRLSHDASAAVRFTIEIDFLCDGDWRGYKTIDVPASKAVTHEFPTGFSAHWVRLRTDTDCTATAMFTYE